MIDQSDQNVDKLAKASEWSIRVQAQCTALFSLTPIPKEARKTAMYHYRKMCQTGSIQYKSVMCTLEDPFIIFS